MHNNSLIFYLHSISINDTPASKGACKHTVRALEWLRQHLNLPGPGPTLSIFRLMGSTHVLCRLMESTPVFCRLMGWTPVLSPVPLAVMPSVPSPVLCRPVGPIPVLCQTTMSTPDFYRPFGPMPNISRNKCEHPVEEFKMTTHSLLVI